MSEPNSTEWAQLFIDFHTRHKDGNGKKRKYTAVFNAAMDAFINCPDVPLTWQLLALVWRTSWGNSSDFCVEGIGSESALTQQKLAERLGVDKRRVNDSIAELRDWSFVELSTGHKVYAVDDPSRIGTPAEDPAESKSPGPSGLFREFCDDWKVRASADFQELESAEATVSRLRKVRLGAFKEWKRSRTFGGPSLYPTVLTTNNVQEQSSSSAVEVVAGRKAEEEEPPTMALIVSAPPAPPATWETFRQSYPPDHLDGPKAKPLFEALDPQGKRNCIERLQVFLKCPRWLKSPQYIPLASTWLQSAYDEPPPPFYERLDHKVEEEKASILNLAEVIKRRRLAQEGI